VTTYLATLPELLAAVSDRARDEVGAVTGIPVWDGEPALTDWPALTAAMRQADGRIEAWVVDVGYAEAAYTLGPVSELTLHVRVRGFRSMQLEAGSREAFRRTVGTLFDRFRRGNLGGLVDILDPPVSQLGEGQVIDEALVSDVLCHRASLVLTGRTEIG
jgi:hypothetical protein